MNIEEQIKEKVMQFAKELIAIRDTDNTKWLLNEAEKASEKLKKELSNLLTQQREEAEKKAEKALKNYQYRIFYGEKGKDNGVLGILRKYSAYIKLDDGDAMWKEMCDLTRLKRAKYLSPQREKGKV